MRKMYLLFALPLTIALLPVFCSAQSSQPGFYNHVLSGVPGPDGATHLFIWEGNDLEGSPKISVQRIQPFGSATTVQLLAQGIPLGYDVLPVADGYLAVATFFQCDIILPWRLYKMDWDGNLQWEQDLDFPAGFDEPLKLLPASGDQFWVFQNGQKPHLYAADGTPAGAGPVDLRVFDGFRITSSGRRLAYGPGGLALYNANLTSYQFALNNTPLFGAEPLPDGTYIALSADSLYRLDADFGLIKARAHNLPVDAALRMTLAGGEIRILTQTAPRQLLRFDVANLGLLETIPIPVDAPFQPLELLGLDDALLLAGNERYGFGSSTQVLEVRTQLTSITPDFGATADAALDRVAMPLAPIGQQVPPSMYSAIYSIKLDSAYVVLRNAGSAVLESVTLNSVFATNNFLCGPQEEQYRKTFTNLNLAQGDSTRLPLGHLQWVAPGVLPSGTYLCVWTTLPNDSLDADLMNNIVCGNASIMLGVNQPKPKPEPLGIWPNPVGNRALLKWLNVPSGEAVIQLFDQAGRLEFIVRTTGSSWTFERGQLPAGTYMVLVRNAPGQLFTGRMLLR